MKKEDCDNCVLLLDTLEAIADDHECTCKQFDCLHDYDYTPPEMCPYCMACEGIQKYCEKNREEN